MFFNWCKRAFVIIFSYFVFVSAFRTVLLLIVLSLDGFFSFLRRNLCPTVRERAAAATSLFLRWRRVKLDRQNDKDVRG